MKPRRGDVAVSLRDLNVDVKTFRFGFVKAGDAGANFDTRSGGRELGGPGEARR
jgi:hypothetical protein